MRGTRRSLVVVVAALALCSVAGQASAGQARQRSAPPSSSSRGSSSQPSQSGRESSRPQVQQRREAPQAPSRPQSSTQQQPRNDSRGYTPRGGNDGGNGRYDSRNVPQRQYEPQRQVAPQRQYAPQGQYAAPQRQAVPRYNNGYNNDYRNDNYRSNNYSSRNNYSNNSYGNRGYRDSRYSGYGGYSGYYGGSRIIIAPRQSMRFSTPYFSFRPYLRLSIGLTMGYPFEFPSWYDPYVVGQPGYVRPYMPYGGVTFDVQPNDAELWIDGEYVGLVSDYSPYDPPLTLVAGRHHVELRGDAYRSLEFDITVISGQVIPYQGTLPYYR